MKVIRPAALIFACGAFALAQPAPTTRPATRSAEDTLSQMLKPSAQQAQPLKPIPGMTGMVDATSGPNAIAPGAATQPVIREGSFIIDRVGRMTKIDDTHPIEFTFDSDGRAMTDPPVILLPNLNLMKMESASGGTNRDLRFRITGEVTEYNGRNYVLLQKVTPIADLLQPLK